MDDCSVMSLLHVTKLSDYIIYFYFSLFCATVMMCFYSENLDSLVSFTLRC